MYKDDFEIYVRMVFFEKVSRFKKVKCINNPFHLPNIKINQIYEIVGPHPTIKDYFSLVGENNIICFQKREWFETIT